MRVWKLEASDSEDWHPRDGVTLSHRPKTKPSQCAVAPVVNLSTVYMQNQLVCYGRAGKGTECCGARELKGLTETKLPWSSPLKVVHQLG